MTTAQPLAEMTGEFLDLILPTAVDGYLTGAVGHGPHWNAAGRYTHTQFAQFAYRWPAQRVEVIAHIQNHAGTCDVWVCPYLMKSCDRAKGNAAYRALLHCDCDKVVDPIKVAEFDGFWVQSGTPDHGHVYIPLRWPVTPAQHDLLERGLVTYMDADPGKISENDLLRPPGTWNHKGSSPTFVMAMP